MPVSNTTPRVVCGQFYWAFQNFMHGRVQENISKQVCELKIAWPMNTTRTLALAVLFVAFCVNADNGCDQTDTGHAKGKTALDSTVTASRSWMLQLAVLNSFRKRKAACFVFYFCISLPGARNGIARMTVVCATVFLPLALLACGDVEANPGPALGNERIYSERSNDSHPKPWYDQRMHPYQAESNDQSALSFLERLHNDMSQKLNDTLTRIETNSRQQGKSIDTRLKRVEEKIDRRLQEVEVRQTELASSMEQLQSKHRKLEAENRFLRDTTTYLTDKCDQLENECKRNNLVFSGFPPLKDTFESWSESEAKVSEVLKVGMGMTDNVIIERAQRHGRAITVKFASFKEKTTVLSNARQLKDSPRFSGIFINEDFSATVLEKRRKLLPVQRELRQKGVKADFRFDKLVTREASFTYDMDTGEVKRWKRYRRPSADPRVSAWRSEEGYSRQTYEERQRAPRDDRHQPGLPTGDRPPRSSPLRLSGRSGPSHPSQPDTARTPTPSPPLQSRSRSRSQSQSRRHRHPAMDHADAGRPGSAPISAEGSPSPQQQHHRRSQRSTSQYNLRTRSSTVGRGSARGKT